MSRMPGINIYQESTSLDNISDDARGFLARLAHLRDKNKLTVPMPEKRFNAFKERGWVDGDPYSASLTDEGYNAAFRICGAEGIKEAFKRKKLYKPPQLKMKM